MTTSPDSFKARLQELVANFDRDRGHFYSKRYLEAQVRLDFITPFFEALGWDTVNKAGLRQDQREVLVERGADDTLGRPDYNFRISGQTKFFVEAKAPSEPLSTIKHIMQAKSYVWNTRDVFFVMLTDFAELRLYDASIRPDDRKPDEGLLLKLAYPDYLNNVEKLWEFSKERVTAGSLDALLPQGTRVARMRIPVDQAFLDEMTEWREDLAKAIYKNNPSLTARQLNEIVQRLLDRIVFIRIAEDRRIIEKRQLADAVDEWKARGGKYHIFEWLQDLFARINDDFNGEIFKPRESDKIKPESEVLARIIERLYPPKSPYRFDVIGVELLGSIYERYLGKTIRATVKQVRVEDKPEVRHAGGVYYTPKYIVDHIVKQTVGKIIDGKTPKQIENVHILDPACGSGSFLIGAFQYLIDHHVRYLTEHPKEAGLQSLFPDLVRDGDGAYRLSVWLKAKLLRNNLYGVDIDPQAVEITMMSLYLKALEGEKSLMPPKQHLLPELKSNIICGNSLIEHDIYDQGVLFADEDANRINVFDWNSDSTGFGRIMKEGGFDCVIANPPYIRIQVLQKFSPLEASYLKSHYKSAASGNFDIYVCFVEKGLSALKERGRLGFILPTKFFQTDYGAALRALLVKEGVLDRVVDFSHLQVFDGPSTYTCLLFLTRSKQPEIAYLKIDDEARLKSFDGNEIAFPADSLSEKPWVFSSKAQRAVFRKMEAESVRLLELPTEISRGSSSGSDDVFILAGTERQGVYLCSTGESVSLEPEILRIPLYATDFGRYHFAPSESDRIIFPYIVDGASSTLLSEIELKSRFPRTFDYLKARKKQLESRRQFSKWYGFSAPRNLAVHDSAHLLVPLLADRGLFSIFPATERRYCLMASGGFSIRVSAGAQVSARFLLGLLNSKLLFSYLRSISNVFRGGWITCTKQYIGPLPIRLVKSSDVTAQSHHDRIVLLVNRMLDLNHKKRSGKLAQSQIDGIERAIETTDAEIDTVVNELYEITDE